MIASVCVFCGSSRGTDPRFVQAAESLGRILAARGQRLVYGGGNIGCMGAMARAAMAAGGAVTGIIPRRLHERVDNVELTELIVVGDMHERKARMHELSGAFVALPGGLGTLEEFFEAWTWRQLGYHAKPLGLLDVGGFFEPLLAFLGRASAEGFMDPAFLGDPVVDDDPTRLLDRLESVLPPASHKLPERGRRADA